MKKWTSLTSHWENSVVLLTSPPNKEHKCSWKKPKKVPFRMLWKRQRTPKPLHLAGGYLWNLWYMWCRLGHLHCRYFSRKLKWVSNKIIRSSRLGDRKSMHWEINLSEVKAFITTTEPRSLEAAKYNKTKQRRRCFGIFRITVFWYGQHQIPNKSYNSSKTVPLTERSTGIGFVLNFLFARGALWPMRFYYWDDTSSEELMVSLAFQK